MLENVSFIINSDYTIGFGKTNRIRNDKLYGPVKILCDSINLSHQLCNYCYHQVEFFDQIATLHDSHL